MKNKKGIVFSITVLFIMMNVIVGCGDKSKEKQEVTVKEEANIKEEVTVKEETNIKEESKKENSFLEIESINLQNLVNPMGKLGFDTAVDQAYNGERTVFYGERIFVNIKFSEDIVEEEPIALSSKLTIDPNIDDMIKKANPKIDINTWITEKNELMVGFEIPIDETEEKDIDIVIPKEFAGISGANLNEDKIIKLTSVPHVFVKAVSEDEENSFSKMLNVYNTFIPINTDYTFSLIFNTEIDKDGVMEKVKEAFDEYNGEYEWVNDKEIKISLKNIKEDITSNIDLSSVLDEKGNRIYTTILIVIGVGH